MGNRQSAMTARLEEMGRNFESIQRSLEEISQLVCALDNALAPNSPSMRRVLSIPALIEAILIHLPARDLLLGQRVNKMFKDTIFNSQTLQSALSPFRHQDSPSEHLSGSQPLPRPV